MALTHEPDPHFLIAQSPRWAIVLNRNQDLLGRCYLVLRRPETDVAALTGEELAELWGVLRKVKEILTNLWEPDHFNYAFLMNLDPQVHFHVIPRYRTRREFAGGTFVDPGFGDHYNVGPARTLEAAGYDAILAALRDRFR